MGRSQESRATTRSKNRSHDATLASACGLNNARAKRHAQTHEVHNGIAAKRLKARETKDELDGEQSTPEKDDLGNSSLFPVVCDGFAGYLEPTASFSDASTPLLMTPVLCYCCRTPFRLLHFFYSRLCPKCAELNFNKRTQVAVCLPFFVINSFISDCKSGGLCCSGDWLAHQDR
jgi:hypothetical protein